MRSVRPVGVVAALAILAALPRAASADDSATAAARAAEARKLGDQKRFGEALVKFRDAYALDPRTEYLCNIGFAHYALDAMVDAYVYLSLCDAKAETKPKGLADVLTYIRTKLDAAATHALVTVTVEPGDVAAKLSSPAIDGGAALPAPTTAYVPVGVEIRWTATAAGHVAAEHRQIFERAGPQSVTIKLAPEPRAEPSVRPTPEVVPDREPVVIEPAPAERSRLSRTGAWVAAGGAVVAAGFGVFAYTRAADPIDELERDFDHDPPNRDDLVGRFHVWYAVEWTSFGVAVAAAGVSTWLFLRDDSERAPSVSAGPTGDGQGGMVWMTWSR